MTPTTFASLGVPAPLVAVLSADGKTTPFPIQADTLPDTLAGRDVLGRGKTGSGKTIAFALPMAARLGTTLAGGKRRAGHPLGLVLAPTRELATQIQATVAPLAAAYKLTTTTIFGGVNQKRQVDALNRGVDIVIACPGRLEDLMKQGFVSLDAVEITVLDEADFMADLGFLPVVTRILAKTPAGGQRMLFSATLDNGVDTIVRRFLSDPVMHSVDTANAPVAAMTHHVFEVAGTEAKTELVRTLASGRGKRILFTRTKHHAKKLAKQLTASGVPAADLHGNLSQPQRDRNLAAFADGSVRVLVATDVAARGVHIDEVELVVHVDPPVEHKAYVHRSGRTARAGSAGDVVTICLPEQRSDLAVVLRKAAIAAKPVAVTSQTPAVLELVGEIAEYVAPVAAPRDAGSRGGAAGSRGGAAGSRGGAAGSRGGAGRAGGSRGGGSRGGSRDGASRSASRDGGSRDGASRSASRDGASRDRRPRSDAARDGGSQTRGAQSHGGSQTRGAQSHGGSQTRSGASGRSHHLHVGSLVGQSASTARGRGSRRARG